MPDLLTTGECAQILRYTRPDSFVRWARKAGFPIIKAANGRLYVKRADFEAWFPRVSEEDDFVPLGLRPLTESSS